MKNNQMTDPDKKINVLFVEDDETIAYLVKDSLEDKGYQVFHSPDGSTAIEFFNENTCQICILDVMLPDMDGYSLASTIRKTDAAVPILFLTARTLIEDRIKGFSVGADDYIVKPFSMQELLMRMEVFLKRNKINTLVNDSKYTIGKTIFDYSNLSIQKADKTFSLTQREADLLKLLILNSNRIIKREEILKSIWGDDDYFLGRSLDVFISRLRKLLRNDPDIVIENIHGVGFRLKY